MTDPALDVWVWLVTLVFLGLMGARAWVAETSRAQLGRRPRVQRALTAAVVTTLVGLIGLLAVQGGALLVSSVVNGTDPAGPAQNAADPNAAQDPVAQDQVQIPTRP